MVVASRERASWKDFEENLNADVAATASSPEPTQNIPEQQLEYEGGEDVFQGDNFFGSQRTGRWFFLEGGLFEEISCMMFVFMCVPQ